MNKIKIFIAILIIISFIPLVSAYEGLEGSNPLVLIDEVDLTEWSNISNWGLAKNTEIKKVNNSSMEIIIPASAQYQAIVTEFPSIDLSEYDHLGFWFKGNNSGYTLRIGLSTTLGTHFYYQFFTDAYITWQFIELDILGGFAYIGSPDISDIKAIDISMSSDNGVTPLTIYIDYLICSKGEIVPIPVTYTLFNPIFIISLLILILNIVFTVKPIPILAIPLGLMTIVLIAFNFAGNSALPLQPYYSFIIFMVSAISILANGVSMKD